MAPDRLPLCATVALIVVSAAMAQTPRTATSAHSWMQASQHRDGHWPAARAERDLRATSLMVLALLADGNTLKTGPFHEELSAGVSWLRSRQVGEGRFGMHAEPDWILDHAMATLAVSEAALASEAPELHTSIRSGVDVLTRHLQSRDAPDPELLLWSEMVARSAARSRDLQEDATRLARHVKRLRPTAVPADRRQRAALLLLEALDPAADAERLRTLAAPFLEPGWPGPRDMEEPLTVLYVSVCCYRRAGSEPFRRSWRDLSRSLTKALIATQVQVGELRGTWNPNGDFGEDGGRACTTAVCGILATVYYRYCRLSVVTQ